MKSGISTSISRKDLEFMAEDIGPELVAIMRPEEVLKSIGPEKQRQLISLLSPKEILANISIEQLIKDLNPEQQKKLVALVLKLLASSLADQEELTGKSSNN